MKYKVRFCTIIINESDTICKSGRKRELLQNFDFAEALGSSKRVFAGAIYILSGAEKPSKSMQVSRIDFASAISAT